MRIRTTILALPALGAIACVTPPREIDPELDCRNRTVTVNHAAAYLTAHPDYIEMCRGFTLSVRIRPSVGRDQARTSSNQPWLRSSSGTGTTVEITVPREIALGEYKYTIEVDGVGTLDPTIRVMR